MAELDDIDNPYNINGPNFCPEMYVQKLLKVSGHPVGFKLTKFDINVFLIIPRTSQ